MVNTSKKAKTGLAILLSVMGFSGGREVVAVAQSSAPAVHI
jgi:hypothetical protein